MNIKHLLVVKKPLTAVCVFLFTVFGIQSSYADYYPSGIQQNVSEQTLIDNGWTLFLEQTYGTAIGSSGSQLIPSGPYVILTGKAVGSSTLPVLAAGPTSHVFTATALNTPQLINGTYWYYTPGSSIGFAPTNSILQSPADYVDHSAAALDPLRLSWHLLTDQGGWRLGATTWLNGSTDYLKQVWNWNGVSVAPAPAPAPVYVRQSTNLYFSQSLYASDTLSDTDGELRKTVDQIMAKHGSLIK